MSTLNDFIDPDLTASDVVHSSGYGQAAAGGSLASGGAGGLSMEQRRKQMYGRRIVGSYAQSRLGLQHGAARPRTAGQKQARVFDPTTGTYIEKATYGRKPQDLDTGGRAAPPPPPQQRRFSEPPARNYNPFG